MMGVAALPAPSSSNFAPSITLLPPFNLDVHGSRMVARCALAAQHKQRRQRALGGEALKFPAFSLSHQLVGGYDSNEGLLNGLPVNQVRYENVHRQGALFCRSGTWLEIHGGNAADSDRRRYSDEVDEEDEEADERTGRSGWKGVVRGTRRESSRFSILEFITVAFGIVSIRGLASQHYLCMDGRGKLYSAPQENYTPECVFMEEMLENYYNLYSSCSYGSLKRPWYVALRKTGRVRKGRHTRKKQKSSHFLVIHFDDHNQKEWKSRGPDGAVLSYGHAATRVHPDFLGESWKSFYSTSLNPTDGRTNKWSNTHENKRPDREWSDPSTLSNNQESLQHHPSSFARVFSPRSTHPSKGLTTSSYPDHRHRHHNQNNRNNNHPQHKPSSENEPLAIVVDSTVLSTTEKFRKDRRRKRRLEREEKRRQRRKTELERLRLSTQSHLRRHPS